MKIGILTYHFCYNFGANLQALSTLLYLKKHNHTPVIIDWRPPKLLQRYKKETPQQQATVHEEFFQHFFPMTKRCKDAREVAQVIEQEDMDAVMIGSDAVIQYAPYLTWFRPNRRKGFYYFYFHEDNMIDCPYLGSFHKFLSRPVSTAMFSVSAQNMAYQHLTALEQKRLRDQMGQSLCSVTVRDTWTQKLFQSLYPRVSVQISPDPVFGFEDNIRGQVDLPDVRAQFNLPEKFVLLTLPGNEAFGTEWRRKLIALWKAKNIQCFFLPSPTKTMHDEAGGAETIPLPLSPLQWYALLKNCHAYIGYNMHPIVSCLHNGIPFFALDQYSVNTGLLFRKQFDLQSSKVYDLLNRSGLLDNYYNQRWNHSLSPEDVFDAIEKFPKERARQLGQLKLNEYKFFMNISLERLMNKTPFSS